MLSLNLAHAEYIFSLLAWCFLYPKEATIHDVYFLQTSVPYTFFFQYYKEKVYNNTLQSVPEHRRTFVDFINGISSEISDNGSLRTLSAV